MASFPRFIAKSANTPSSMEPTPFNPVPAAIPSPTIMPKPMAACSAAWFRFVLIPSANSPSDSAMSSDTPSTATFVSSSIFISPPRVSVALSTFIFTSNGLTDVSSSLLISSPRLSACLSTSSLTFLIASAFLSSAPVLSSDTATPCFNSSCRAW